MTHDNERTHRGTTQRPTELPLQVVQRWRVVAALAVSTVYGCGAHVEGGNTGSETHWLQACDSDSDCGQYSCLCGVCTRGCESNAQCEEPGGPDATCADKGEHACDGDAPAQICIARDAVSPDAGDTVTARDAGARSENSTSSDTAEPVTTGTDASTPDLDPVICDGSDDIRLWTQTTAGGLAGANTVFASAYGWAYLAIDGKCNYWASKAGELFTGTITDADVLRDYERSYFGKLARFADFDAGLPCPDAPNVFVADSSGIVRINVCGVDDPPPDYEATWDAISALTDVLVTTGQRSTGPLRMALGPAESGDQVWPLDLAPGEWVSDAFDYGTLALPEAGIWVNAGATAESLRAAGPGTFSYEAGDGSGFLTLLLRDELPPQVKAILAQGQLTTIYTAEVGAACDDSSDCSNGHTCMTQSDARGGGRACNTCIAPGADGADWKCQSNADCCGGLVCCVDCGENSGTCVAEVDPCETCVASGGSFVMPNTCDTTACVPDSTCFTDECPALCAPDSCDGCGRSEECWAAGCEWMQVSESAFCAQSTPVQEPQPCFIDATDESLPGVTIHLEADTCEFSSGQGGQFRYTVTLNQSLDFTTESSGGGCGLCWSESDPATWIDFRISGNQLQYCPECDVGCCPPTEPTESSLDAGSVEDTVDWPGLQWSGPSDTGNVPSGEFPPGSYAATVTLAVPGLGQVVAELPIEVTE